MEPLKTFESFTDSLNEENSPAIFLPDVKAALPALEALIKKEIDLSVKLDARMTKGNRDEYLTIFSADLKKDLGNTLVKTLFKTIQIEFWGGTVTKKGDSIWFNPKIGWQSASSGSNGSDFIWDSLWYVISSTPDLKSAKPGTWVTGNKVIG